MNKRIQDVLILLVCGFFGLLILGFQNTQPTVEWQHALSYKPDELFPVSIGKYGLPYIKVWINGQEQTLVWDTGNMSGLLLSTRVAQELKLPVIAERKHYDSDGTEVGTYKAYRVGQLRVFGKGWAGEQAHEDRRDLDGLIGPRYVLGKRFTLDYKSNTIAISETPLPQETPTVLKLPMILSTQHEGLILVRGFVNGREVLIEIDTGKSRTVVDPFLANLLRLPKTATGYRIEEVTFGPYKFAVASAKEVSFKGISQTLPEPIMLSVGSDILSQVILTVDYPQRVVVISR